MKTLLCSSIVIILVVALAETHNHETHFTNVENCRATKIHMPVCGSDGNSYVNKDMFNCANDNAGGSLTIEHEGVCEHEHGESGMTKTMGNDGSTVKLSTLLGISTISLALFRLK